MGGFGCVGQYAIGGPLLAQTEGSGVTTIAIFGDLLLRQARANNGDPTPHNLLPWRRHRRN